MGRDPIEEEGGLNLYGFVRNNPVNAWDYLGLAYGDTHEDNENIPEGYYDVGDGIHACPFGFEWDGKETCRKDDNAPRAGSNGQDTRSRACKMLQERFEYARWVIYTQEKELAPGGAYDFQSDALGFGLVTYTGTVAGALTALWENKAGALPSQSAVMGPYEMVHYNDRSYYIKSVRRVTLGAGGASLIFDVYGAVDAIANGESEERLLAAGNVGYGVLGIVMGGPVGVVFGVAQAGVNGVLMADSWRLELERYRHTERARQMARDTIASAQSKIEEISFDMYRKGCE